MDLSRLELHGAMEATTRVMAVDLPGPLEALPAEEVACHNDMLSVGMQPGEAEALPIRVIATIITASILSAWCDRSKTQRKLLFFAHWFSGLVYLLSEWVMATMILACWSNRDVSWFIKVWKFVELTADNMLAATNFAICLQLSLIVSGAQDGDGDGSGDPWTNTGWERGRERGRKREQ